MEKHKAKIATKGIAVTLKICLQVFLLSLRTELLQISFLCRILNLQKLINFLHQKVCIFN